MITGWEAVREHQVNLLNSSWMDWQEKQFQNIQIAVCEKQEGRGTIAFQVFMRHPEHLEVIDMTAEETR